MPTKATHQQLSNNCLYIVFTENIRLVRHKTYKDIYTNTEEQTEQMQDSVSVLQKLQSLPLQTHHILSEALILPYCT